MAATAVHFDFVLTTACASLRAAGAQSALSPMAARLESGQMTKAQRWYWCLQPKQPVHQRLF
jgi:hypothetical protein